MEVTSSGRLADAGADAKPTIITVPTTPTASKGALRLGFWALGSSVCQAFAKSVAPSQRTPTKLLSHFISALRHSQRKECYFSGSQGKQANLFASNSPADDNLRNRAALCQAWPCATVSCLFHALL
jgi:hypothetical protein